MSAIAGYGVDTWCARTLVSGRLARGTRVVALAVFRRFITPRGTLHGLLNDDCTDFLGGDEEGRYGLDLSAYVGAVGTDIATAALPAFMVAEAEKDDRVASATAEVSQVTRSDGMVSLYCRVTGFLRDSEDVFALTFSVDAAATNLLEAY